MQHGFSCRIGTSVLSKCSKKGTVLHGLLTRHGRASLFQFFLLTRSLRQARREATGGLVLQAEQAQSWSYERHGSTWRIREALLLARHDRDARRAVVLPTTEGQLCVCVSNVLTRAFSQAKDSRNAMRGTVFSCNTGMGVFLCSKYHEMTQIIGEARP